MKPTENLVPQPKRIGSSFQVLMHENKSYFRTDLYHAFIEVEIKGTQ